MQTCFNMLDFEWNLSTDGSSGTLLSSWLYLPEDPSEARSGSEAGGCHQYQTCRFSWMADATAAMSAICQCVDSWKCRPSSKAVTYVHHIIRVHRIRVALRQFVACLLLFDLAAVSSVRRCFLFCQTQALQLDFSPRSYSMTMAVAAAVTTLVLACGAATAQPFLPGDSHQSRTVPQHLYVLLADQPAVCAGNLGSGAMHGCTSRSADASQGRHQHLKFSRFVSQALASCRQATCVPPTETVSRPPLALCTGHASTSDV